VASLKRGQLNCSLKQNLKSNSKQQLSQTHREQPVVKLQATFRAV
jgi:hypothetical protein